LQPFWGLEIDLLTALFWQTSVVIIFSRFCLLFFVAVSIPSYAQLVSPGTERDRLTYAELIEGETTMEEPSHNGYFMPVGQGQAAPAKHDLSGTLVISETSRWPFGTFPGVRVKIFRSGNQLFPVTRDIIRADKPGRWNLIFSPGRVWSEPGDKGLSRASFPFVLASRGKNKAHNGLARY
jgi:hypothetical protein